MFRGAVFFWSWCSCFRHYNRSYLLTYSSQCGIYQPDEQVCVNNFFVKYYILIICLRFVDVIYCTHGCSSAVLAGVKQSV